MAIKVKVVLPKSVFGHKSPSGQNENGVDKGQSEEKFVK
jgi:hypothetical protein